MTNIYDDDFNLDDYAKDSAGYRLAKANLLFRFILILYVGAFLYFFAYAYLNHTYTWGWFMPEGVYYVPLAIVTFGLIILTIGGKIIYNKIMALDYTEKLYYDLYLYHKSPIKTKTRRNAALVAMARLNCLMGDEDLCRCALDMITHDYKHDNLEILRKWVNSEKDKLTEDDFKEVKAPRIIKPLVFYGIIIYGLLFFSLNYTYLPYKGFSYGAIGFLGIIALAGLSYCYLFIAMMVIKAVKPTFDFTSKVGKAVIAVICGVILIILFIRKFDFFDYCFDLTTDESEEYVDEDYSYDSYDDYDYSYEDDTNYIDLSENVNDLDIMNYMIALSDYLLDEGVISDFKKVELSYTAKGVVRGTINKDENYEYNLYDNGIKQDENGNDCLELVLEAEPLDENGISKGQQEASLKGFYLVNIETKEIIDEHKTHW